MDLVNIAFKILPSLILAASVSGIANADAPQYTLTDIGPTVRFGDYFGTTTINSAGTILGNGGDGTTSHAFLYNGATHDLGTLGGGNSVSTAMNANNKVVGFSNILGDSAYHAFYYDSSMHDLGTLGGTNSVALAINSSNTVVGYADTADANHAFYFNGSIYDLGTLGGNYSAASAINDSGMIVGSATVTGDAETHAFMYDGAMHDLGTLGGTFADAFSISSNGIIVGNSMTGGDNFNRAFLYDGTMHDLGTLGGDNSEALAVNAKGWVVGRSEVNPGDSLSTIFIYDGSNMYDLSALLANSHPTFGLDQVFGIDDSGQLLVMGTDMNSSDGGERLFSLNLVPQVPIPASGWLLGSCLLGLVGLRQKSKHT